jgi:protein O-GlcNAc transferase
VTATSDLLRALADHRHHLAKQPNDSSVLPALFAVLDALDQPGAPEEAVARSNYGEALRRQGRATEAEAHHRQAVAWLPSFGGNHFNLGVTLQALGKIAEAADAYGEAARLMPSFAGAACNQGAMLRELGRLAEAETALRQALALDGGLAVGWLNLAAVWRDQGKMAEAVQGFRNTLALRPDLAEAQANLALALKEVGRVPDSLPGFERALRLGLPDSGGVLAQLIQQRRHLCRWDGLEILSERLVAAVRDGTSQQIHPWIFLGEGAGPRLERLCAERYSAWRARGVQPAFPICRTKKNERLRIGYLSADFHEHATAVLIVDLIERHDRNRFTIIGASYGPDDGGPMRARLRRGFDEFLDLSALSDEAAARCLRDHDIDVLIDLKGHTNNARPGIAAHRPAPVQAQWLGYPGTMGAPFIDWIIADAVVAPLDRADEFSERIIRLPGSYQPNDGARRIGETPSRTACGLPEQGFVFCCFNAAYKINPTLFDRWCRILANVPDSVLWLLDSHAEVAPNLRREATARGITPERLVFSPRLPGPEYLARYRLADLFLDTGPVGAHTTASDALWAGLPVLTVLGNAFVGRVGASLLRAVSLPDLVMADWDAYELTALRLARDPAAMVALKRRLSAALPDAALFDTDRFARALEEVFINLWADHAQGEIHR